MNKLDTQPHNTSFAMTSYRPGSHLIILVPETGPDPLNGTHRIWELAHATGMSVLFLGVCKRMAQELALRRRLVTLSALVADGRVPTDAKTEIGMDWVEAVRTNYRTGDMIVCFADQRAGLFRRSLSQILESNLKVPVYILSGSEPQQFKSDWPSQAIGWSGSIGIILIFGILQIKIVQLPEGWFQSALFILSIIPEYWLIWVWNNLFS